MNVELLEKAKQSILGDPLFDMGNWDHCICGHVAKVSGRSALSTRHIIKLLDITGEQSANLFFSSGWPEEYRHSTRSPVNACHLIDHFIEVDGKFAKYIPQSMFGALVDYTSGFFRREPARPQYTTTFTNMVERVYPTPVVVPTSEPTLADIAAIDSLLAEANVEEEICELV